MDHGLAKKAYKQWSLLIKLFQIVVGGIGITYIVVMGLFFFLFSVDDFCIDRNAFRVHEIHANLKDVCDERKTDEECPKTEQDLAAFDPIKYQYLQSCAKTVYHYDAANQTYTWLVRFARPEVVGSQSKHDIGIYSLDKTDVYSSSILPKYPPVFPGPWHLLPK
jgi:hypothetical protein